MDSSQESHPSGQSRSRNRADTVIGRTTSQDTVPSARVLARDYADQHPPQSNTLPRTLRNVLSNYTLPASIAGTSTFRRRVNSIQASGNPSPGPSNLWHDVYNYSSSRRSVAIAPTATGRDLDNESRKFSLAGPAPIDTVTANQPYVDPGYTQLNPAYDQPSNVRPVWSLAKPLPRVLRSGMVPAKDELEQELAEERDEQVATGEYVDLENGRIEPSFRPDRVVDQLDTIRREREISLFRAYRQLEQSQAQRPGSPSFSTFSPLGAGRRRSDATETTTTKPRDTIEEEPDERRVEFESESRGRHESAATIRGEPPDTDLPQLREAMANVAQAREEESLKVPYVDAVPLPAYQAEDDEVHNLHTYWSVIRLRFREPLAELLGIMVQYTLGFSATLSSTVSRSGTNDTGTWAWGLATMIAIYVAGGISGAHLNPAISFMLYVYRGFPLRKMPAYILAQMVGAFLAALIAFGVFQPGLIALQERDRLVGQDPAMHLTANVNVNMYAGNGIDVAKSHGTVETILANFITFPRQPWVTDSAAFCSELLGTTLLSVSVLALGDDTNAPPGAGMNAFIVGLLVVVLGMAFGANTGLAMNPARDFGPRLAMLVLGLGDRDSLFGDGYWFRVAWMAPLCGVTLGGFLYDSAIFVGGESPVNYPAVRVRRATRKWRERMRGRFGRVRRMGREVKVGVMGGVGGYEAVDG